VSFGCVKCKAYTQVYTEC